MAAINRDARALHRTGISGPSVQEYDPTIPRHFAEESVKFHSRMKLALLIHPVICLGEVESCHCCSLLSRSFAKLQQTAWKSSSSHEFTSISICSNPFDVRNRFGVWTIAWSCFEEAQFEERSATQRYSPIKEQTHTAAIGFGNKRTSWFPNTKEMTSFGQTPS